MTTRWPRRGEVWLAAMPDESKRRPCVVLSADWLNRYALDVMVVPVTSVARGNFPTRVELPAGEGGLRVASWAKCDQVTTVSKKRLTGEPFGHLSQAKMQEIADAVRLALDL
ncbi:MAG: type II toxin-antitoxin system PemK/MazF family toxin [Anaerolineae bacterium]